MSIRACTSSLVPPASEPLTSAEGALAVTAAEQARAAGVDLVDSFVVAGGLAASLADPAGVAHWAG